MKRRWHPVLTVCPGCGRKLAIVKPDGTPTTCKADR